MSTTETIRVAYSAELQNWSLTRVRNKPGWVAEVGVLLAEFTDGPLQRRVLVAAACDVARALLISDMEIVSDDLDRAQEVQHLFSLNGVAAEHDGEKLA